MAEIRDTYFRLWAYYNQLEPKSESEDDSVTYEFVQESVSGLGKELYLMKSIQKKQR